MKLSKANLAGLTSPGQQSEMKSILAGTWPPLKPLPVFKYETAEYRATISFDRKRGEWACRKTSLPSNEVQELRGGLQEITMALPHGEADVLTEVAEPQEQESEQDTRRRLQAIREWREKYENGARYFEIRDFLSEGQRTELDVSLRLTLTARQLQFSPRNLTDVFDDLSVAGGRFAALIEFAERNKANNGIEAGEQEAETLPGAECTIDHDEQLLEISPPELEGALHNNDPFVPHQETAEACSDANEFPALSIKNVFPEPDQTSLAERMAHTASQQFEIETSDSADDELPSLTEHSHSEHTHAEGSRSHAEHSDAQHSHGETRHAAVFTSFAAEVPAGQPFADSVAGSSSRFPGLKISAFQANVFVLLFLFAVTSFAVGLTVGRGPLGKRLREAPKSLLAADAKPPTPILPDPSQPDAADESTPRTLLPQAASSDTAVGMKGAEGATLSEKPPASEEKPRENSRISDSAEARSTDADSSPPIESRLTPKPEVNLEPRGAIGPVVRTVPPPASSKLVRPSSKLGRRPKAVRSMRAPRNAAPYKLTSAIAAAPHAPRTSTILVTVPDRGSQPFRVSFPNKTIAATSSLAMTSQLSVFVSPEPEASEVRRSARLEAGELVFFGWPRYPSPGDHHGVAETIKVRAMIGQLGQVQEVKFLGGSASLLPATMEAVRQWRYTPTLLDRRPIQAQQDVTIEFRPPQYSARLSTQHPSHN